MSKKDEKIIISKKLAEDLIWWLDHADVPFNDGWLRRYVNGNREFTQMEIARDSMVYELLIAIEQSKSEPIDLFEGMNLDRTYSDNLEKLIKEKAEGKL